MKITVDRARCTGHGRCYALAPDVYQPDDDGYCQHAIEITSAALAHQARLGAQNCPEDAITVIAEQGDPP